MDVSPFNYSRYVDRTLDELYQKQSRTTDPEERRRYLREFEKRLLDDEAHYIFTFQWHRIVPQWGGWRSHEEERSGISGAGRSASYGASAQGEVR